MRRVAIALDQLHHSCMQPVQNRSARILFRCYCLFNVAPNDEEFGHECSVEI